VNRRFFFFVAASFCASPVFGKDKKFVFRIKTKNGSIVGNIVIYAKNMDAAKHKLREQHPDCEILDAEEK